VAYALALDDIDGDDRLDVVAITDADSSSQLAVFLGQGDGGFAAARTSPLAYSSTLRRTLAFGDLDGDGRLDAVILHVGDGVSVLLGRGDGTFAPSRAVPSGIPSSSQYALALGDLDGDGRLDLVTVDRTYLNAGEATYYTRTAGVQRGRGDGTFESARLFMAGAAPDALLISDLNGDGRQDVITANNGFDVLAQEYRDPDIGLLFNRSR
jgi:hypothetical protein